MSQGRDTIITYRGPSMYDPTSTIFSALTVGSTNKKTGNMPQQYIFRQDVSPVAATRQGLDFAVCGCCMARPIDLGGCYVVGYKLDGWWRAWRNRPVATDKQILHTIGYRPVRLGAYGDTAAMPPREVLRLVSLAKGRVTNYTHGWTTLGWKAIDFLRPFTMASVESEAEAAAAWLRGWRTYRIIDPDHDVKLREEVRCPYETTGLQCYDCLLCDGAKRRADSIVIDAHGSEASTLPKIRRVLDSKR
jgi:hypothetical protein